MYKIYANDTLIHYAPLFDSGYVLLEPAIKKDSLYAQGSFTFTMAPSHPCYDEVEPLNTIITVMDDTEELFRGRVINTTTGFYNQKEVYCEGELAFLLDSYYRPFGFAGGVSEFFTAIIDNHNSQVDATRQFQVGEITVSDANDYITRSSNTPLTSWDMINDKLIDLLGGYIRVRVSGGVRYIDYLADYEDYNDQTIQFGENLLDIENYVSAEDIITCLIPYGAEYDSGDDNYTEQPENGSYNGNRVTIESVTDDGRDYVYSETGVALYGEIWGTNTWDDVTLASNLLTKAQAYVDANIAAATTLTIKAVDLHLVDVDVTRIHLGDYVKVYSKPHNISVWLQCTAMSIDLQNPEDTEITLGAGSATLTGAVSGTSSGGRSTSSGAGSYDTATLLARVIAIENDYVTHDEVNNLVAESATIETLIAQVAAIEDAYITSATVETLLAGYATVDELSAASARITTLESSQITTEYLSSNYALITDLTAAVGRIATLESNTATIAYLQTYYATIEQLDATSANITALDTDIASIKTLLAGNESVETLQAIHLTSDNVVIDNAVITSAMIASLTADKLTSGTIYTDNIKIANNTGENLLIDGSTIQISDGTYVRVQIGEDGTGDYNLYLWDADGTLIWNAYGLTEDGLTGNGAIVKDMAVADDAAISGYKLDIDSVTSYLNSYGQLVVDSANITVDNTTLNYALTTLTTNTDAAAAAAAEASEAAKTAQDTADKAQADATQAASDAATAQSAADTAAANAASAQSAADDAQALADAAQAAADAAQAAADNINIGARNLAQDAYIVGYSTASKIDKTDYIASGTIISTHTSSTDGFHFDSADIYETNTEYTISFWIQLDSGTFTGLGGHNGRGVTYTSFYIDGTSYGSFGASSNTSCASLLNDGDKHYVVIRYTTPSTISADSTSNSYLYIQPNRDSSTAVTCTFTGFKLELGNVATDWTPAPEDLQAAADAAQALADEAQAAAAAAQSAADTAASDAAAAQSTADTAKANAATAQAAADDAADAAATAQATADAAQDAVDAVEKRTTVLETSLTVVQGQITAKVWQSDITEAIDALETTTSTGNLIENGYGQLASNYNFTNWTFAGSEVYENKPCYTYTVASGYKGFLMYDDPVPIDLAKEYLFSMYAKSSSSTAKYCFGFAEYDVDGKYISPMYQYSYTKSTTTLSKDLNNGDTVVYLTDVSGWTNSTSSHQLGLIFWNYTDGAGRTYEPGEYSRNAWYPLYSYDNIDFDNNTITLNSAWTHGTFEAGVSVSQSNSSGYKYFWSNKVIGTDWVEISGQISGIQDKYSYSYSKFNPATKSINVYNYLNYGGLDTDVTTYINSVSLVDNTVNSAIDDLNDNYTILSDNYATLTVTVNGISSDVGSLTTTVTNNYTEVSNKIATVSETVDGITETVSALDKTVSSNYTELSDKITTVETTVSGITTTVSDLSETVTSNYSTLSSRITTVETTASGLSVTVSEIQSAYENLIVDGTFGGYTTFGSTSAYSWYRTSSTYITVDTYSDKPCVKFAYGGSAYYIRQIIDWPAGTYIVKAKLACGDGFTPYARARIGSTYAYLNTDDLTTDWATYSAVITTTTTSTYFYLYCYAANGTTSTTATEMYVTDIAVYKSVELEESYSQITALADSISMSVTGSLGGTASIVLSANGSSTTGTIDLSNVREAFADDTTAVTISAGTITFSSNTLIINSDQLTLDSSGNATYSGALSAATGTFYGDVTAYSGVTLGGNLSVYKNYVVNGDFVGFADGWSTTNGTGWYRYPASSTYIYGSTYKGLECACMMGTGTGYYIRQYQSGGLASGTYIVKARIAAASASQPYAYVRARIGTTSSGVYGYLCSAGDLTANWQTFYTKITTSTTYNYISIFAYGGTDYPFYITDIEVINEEEISGYIGYLTGASNSTATDGIGVMDSTKQNYFIATTAGARMSAGDDGVFVVTDAGITLSSASTINASVAITVSSDRALKNHVETLPDAYETLFDRMEPVRYYLNHEQDSRYHLGYIANDVLDAAADAGLTWDDTALINQDSETGLLGLNYTEIIALQHQKIKKLEKRIESLELAHSAQL